MLPKKKLGWGLLSFATALLLLIFTIPTGTQAGPLAGLTPTPTAYLGYLPIVLWIPTPTPTNTPTPTATSTPSMTPTPTETGTPTNTPSVTPTPTVTNTPGPTPTPGLLTAIDYPKDVAIDRALNRIFVSSKLNDSVYVIDGATHTVIGQVPVGDEPFGLAANSVTHKVYAVGFKSNDLTVIDATTNTALKTIALGHSEPTYVAVDETRNRVYVASHGAGRLIVIDGHSDTIVDTVFVGTGSFDVAVNAGLNAIFVTNRDSLTVTVVNGFTLAVAQTMGAGGSPFGLTFNPATNKLYVLVAPSADYGNPNLLKVYNSTGSGLFYHKTVSVSNMAEGGVAVNPTTNHIFIPHSAAVNRVTVVDGYSDTVIDSLTLPAYALDDPFGVGVNPDTGWLYIGNRSVDGLGGTILMLHEGP